MRTVDWHDGEIVLVDQTALPDHLVHVRVADVDSLVDAIRRLVVRGAPAIGAAGALGVLLAARAQPDDPALVRHEAARIRAARPTAVNLGWAVDRMLAHLDAGIAALEREALALLDEDVAANEALSRRGADLVVSLCAPPVTVHTHCNAGGLACVEWGTALGIVRALHERGALREVIADETRPLLQGSRITAFELARLGVRYRIVVDGAGPALISRRMADVVVVGADRIAANGDTANKIGTYALALAAHRAGIPFIVAAPESTIDRATPCGDDIPIEQRPDAEILEFSGQRVAPEGAQALNPAFDVTPRDLLTAIVTERRTIRVADGERP